MLLKYLNDYRYFHWISAAAVILGGLIGAIVVWLDGGFVCK